MLVSKTDKHVASVETSHQLRPRVAWTPDKLPVYYFIDLE